MLGRAAAAASTTTPRGPGLASTPCSPETTAPTRAFPAGGPRRTAVDGVPPGYPPATTSDEYTDPQAAPGGWSGGWVDGEHEDEGEHGADEACPTSGPRHAAGGAPCSRWPC